MPRFNSDVDIDVDEFLNSCSKRELNEAIDYLVETGHVYRKDAASSKNILEQEWSEITRSISNCRLRISQEDEDALRKIAKKYEL